MSQSSSWRAGFAATEVIQRVRPTEFKGDLLNPHIGTATFQRFNGDPVNQDNSWDDSKGPEQFAPFTGNDRNQRYPQTTLSYCRWLWSRIEPEKGKYNWQFIDNALHAAAERGQTLQLRVQPYIGDDIPKWYWASGAKRDPAQPDSIHPCHNHPGYVRHWGEFIMACGNRYDGHPLLESFDIAYGGPCGEVGGNASADTAARLVDIYVKAFPKTQLLSMLGTHGCAYAAQLPGKKIGWRADCYGDLRAQGGGQVPDRLAWNHTFDMYPREVMQDHVDQAWKTAPVTLETCWTVGQWHENKWDIDFILDQGLKFHPSVFMPKSCYYPEEWMEKMMAWNRRLGYRLVLRQIKIPLEIKPGENLAADVWIDNVGVAPLYQPYQLALRFRNGDKQEIVPFKRDVRTLMPDNNWFTEEVPFPRSLPRGVATVDIGIIDPATQKPKVKLAIEPVDKDGWHSLTHIDVL